MVRGSPGTHVAAQCVQNIAWLHAVVAAAWAAPNCW
jgi:hypothetical protein